MSLRTRIPPIFLHCHPLSCLAVFRIIIWLPNSRQTWQQSLERKGPALLIKENVSIICIWQKWIKYPFLNQTMSKRLELQWLVQNKSGFNHESHRREVNTQTELWSWLTVNRHPEDSSAILAADLDRLLWLFWLVREIHLNQAKQFDQFCNAY